MKVHKPTYYKATCKACKTIVLVTPDELNFEGANMRRCPTCSNTVFFTDSLGFLHDNVEVFYSKEEKE